MVTTLQPPDGFPFQSGFNIDNFVAQTAGGFKRTNKHLLRIAGLPSGFTGNPAFQLLNETAANLEWYVEGSAIPGVSVGTHTALRYGYGSAEKRPYMPVFNDVNISVLCDDSDDNLYFWKQWLLIIQNFNMSGSINPSSTVALNTVNNDSSIEPFELAYRQEYVTDIQLSIFDTSGTVTTVIKLREAFPIFVGDIQTNWGSMNEIARLPVSLTYVDWFYDYDAMKNGV